jgi:hypothetical protein
MALLPKLRATVALIIAACLLCPPAHALVTFNDSKEHIFVTGTASLAYDSNIYAHTGGGGDTVYSAGLLVEYTRRAGWIGVNGSVGLDLSRFVNNTNENFLNPRFALEFTKASGRTTGTLSLSAARENRADSAVNLREQSWNYAAGLNFKYPVIERYSISGSFDYTDRVFAGQSGLSNLATYSAGADLLYALSSERDLLAGYRYRYSETSTNASFDDQSFTVGVAGKIISRLNGSLRAGYQVRHPHGRATDGAYRGLTAAGAVTWTATKKLSFTGQLSRDVSVTSTDISVDTFSESLDAQYVFNARLSVFANLGGGDSRFLGAATNNRRDHFFTYGGGVNYTMLRHLKFSLAYVYFQNWSTLSYADYLRNTFTLSVSSRW